MLGKEKTFSILISGSAGFIGSNLIDFLIKENEIVGIDNFSNGKIENIKKHLKSKKMKLYKHDLKNPLKISENVDFIFHLAAKIKNNKEAYHENLKITKNILEIARKKDVKKIIYFSSTKVYGLKYNNVEIDESFKCYANDFYGRSKLISERIIKNFCKNYGIKFLIIRLPRVYGPKDWQKTFYSLFLLEKFFGIGINSKLYLNLVYVKNLSKLSKEFLKNKKFDNEIFNVNDGFFKIFEISKTIEKILNKKIIHLNIPDSIFKIYSYVSGSFTHARKKIIYSNKKLKKIISNYPFYSLTYGLKDTINYYENKYF
ncbi:MAG: NAD(P)-dependent oxidoreductase [Candidatus Aenigmatarchaeota archaeon]